MFINFDCSQFITIRAHHTQVTIEQLINKLLVIWENPVLINTQIAPKKLDYIDSYQPKTMYVIELLDQQFLGYFEDWSNISVVPDEILKFKQCIECIIENGYIIENVFIINTPTTDPLKYHKAPLTPLLNSLFCMSLHHTGSGSGCSVLILSPNAPLI